MIFAVNKAMHTNPNKPNIKLIIFPNKDTPTTGSLIDWFTTGQMNEEGILKNLLS